MLDLSQLNYAEKETYMQLVAAFEAKQMTVTDVKNAMTKLKDTVALELAQTPYNEQVKIQHLQARLLNAILLEQVFVAPEKAAEALKKAEENFSKKVNKDALHN